MEAYYDAVPRTAARVEQLGPFTLFVKVGAGWPFYGRPSLGATRFTSVDVQAVRARQAQLEIPQTFEWIAEVTPDLEQAVVAAGLEATRHPLMLLNLSPRSVQSPPDGIQVRSVTPTDDLALYGAVAPVAFSAAGTEIGPAGIADVYAMAAGADMAAVGFRRDRLEMGHTVMAVALSDGEPIGIGSHQPLGTVTEITGIGVLPAFRRRGVGAAVTSFLVHDALARGVSTVFLSAGDNTIARIYERVGFRRIGTACIAEPAAARDSGGR